MLLAILINYIFKKPFSHNTQPMHKTMETKPKTSEVEVIVFPYPIQGHINPMLQFSKQLASRGLKITLVTTSTFSNTNFQSSSITLETIPDGSDHTAKNDPKNIDAFIERFDSVAPQSLTQLIERKLGSKNGDVVRCLVYDSAFPWALDIAKKFGIYGASFFTQNCLVNFIYNQVYLGLLKIPIEGSLDCYDGMPPLVEAESLPSFVRVVGGFPVLEKLVFDQFSNCKDADWCFINSFDALDNKVISSTSNEWAGTTIGPCIPSMYLDKRLTNDTNYGLSLFEPQTDACIQWLNAKEPNSVVYVSMGSIASLDGAQMKEIAKGMEISNKYFLWVVRPSEQNKLPSNFKENTSNKGLIVNWCPQLEVLAHDAIGCFVTHCGWNSTLEAVCLGVPIVAFPQWTDQPTNAKCIVDFWKVGVRVKVEENGFLCGDELCACIEEVMEGEGANKIKSNANMWKKLSIQAMEKGGSSDKNIDEFIAQLL